MRTKYLLVVLALLPFASFAQTKKLAFSLGGNASYTAFKPFENYVASYNTANEFRPGFEALKYNPYGYGMEGEVEYTIVGLYMGFRLAKYNSLKSVSSLPDGNRVYQFKSMNTDVKFGFMVKGFSTYLAMSIHSFNLLSYYHYNDIGFDSYGSEKYISGVYHPFKVQGLLGMRFEKEFDKLGFYIDACAPLNEKIQQHDGLFVKDGKSNSWELAFPQDHNNYNSSSVPLPQIYRNFRLGVGIVYYFSKKEL